MSHLKNKLLISTFILSSLSVALFLSPTCYAQNREAREFNRKGVAALESGRYNDSIQLLKQAMVLEPTWAEPCFNAARLLKQLGKREDMTKMLRKANGLEPTNTKYTEEYLKVLYEDYQAAEKNSNYLERDKISQEIFRVSPGNINLGLKLVENKLDSGNKDEALSLAEDILSKNTRQRSRYQIKEMGKLFYIVAQIAFERGDLDKAKANADYATGFEFEEKAEAKELLKKIKNTIDDKANDLVAQAKSAQQSGNHEKAMSLLKDAEKYQPENESIKNLQVEFVNEIDIDKMIAIAKKANSEGRWLDSRETLHMLLDKYPDSEKAKKMLEELKPKENALAKAIGTEIPITARDRERFLLNLKEQGVNFYKAENYKDCVIPLKKALALIAEEKELVKYKTEIDGYLKNIQDIDSAKDNWAKALDARNANDYEDVLKCLKQLPDDYDIQIDSYFAEAYYKTGDYENAEKHALKQLGIQPENNRARFVMGCIKLEAGKKDEAFRYFADIYKDDPDYPELKDKYAQSSMAFLPKVIVFAIIGIFIWILMIFKKNWAKYSKNGLIAKAQSLLKQEDYDGALKVIMEVRHSPLLTEVDTFTITQVSAQCYLKKGTYDKAIGECKHLISLSPNSEEAHTWLGYAYLGRRMLAPEALPELLRLYKKDSKNIALVSLLGSYYAQQKVISEEGVEILEQWLNLDHDNIDVVKPLGKYYLKKGRSDDKAMKVFQKMMDIGSPDPDFLLGVANVYLKMRQYDNCMQICEHVINNDINNQYVHSILLEAYKRQNKLPELLDIYSNFLQNNPYNVAFQNGLRAAQALYDKIQNSNAAQAQIEAQAVMDRMMSSAPNMGGIDSQQQSTLSSGEIACPKCGKGNPQNGYQCQYCGANLIE